MRALITLSLASVLSACALEVPPRAQVFPDGMAVDSSAVVDAGCGDAFTECGGRCVSTDRDPDHCGACGHACGGEYRCQRGECVCP